MQLFTTLSLTAALTASVSAQGYVHMGFEKKAAAPDSSFSNRLARRQSSTSARPINAPVYQNTNKLEYIVNVTLGTPGQSMGVTFDTGSSDLWVPTSQFCTRRGAKCDLGYYSPASSSTYKLLEAGEFNITYAAPGDSDAGDWVTDSVSIAGSTAISNQIIGAATAGFDSHGVMGFGYDTNEAQPNPSTTNVYKSVLDNMVSQGIINRKAYSVYLDSLNQTVGNILIGGVDSTKYTGPLVALPLQLSDSESTAVREFYVTLTQVAFTDARGATQILSPEGYAQSVLLDTGTSFTSMDAYTIGRLANGLGAVDTGGATYFVPCNYANSNATVSYTFGGSNGVTVTVPVSELIGQQYQGECELAIEPPIGGSCIFGDSFLRSAYVVLDLDTNMAAIAQAVDGKSGTSSIVAIPSGTTIPGASTTLRATGTQLSGAAASSTPNVPIASYGKHSSIMAGTPTFALGVAASASASGTSSSSSSKGAAAPAMTGKPQLAMLGAGLVMGALAL